MPASSRALPLIALSVALASGCAHAPQTRRARRAERLTGGAAKGRLARIKTKLMSADYRADLAALARLREKARHLVTDPDLGYLAHYWAGFSSWRLAMNGANRSMPREEIKAHLQRAAADFEASIKLRKDFADAYAAAAGTKGWLLSFLRTDLATMRRHAAESRRLLAQAKKLAPDNPRVLWIVAASDYLFNPFAFGGDRKRAVAQAVKIYKRMLQVAKTGQSARSPLPDWGKPEALMSLAYAHSRPAALDLDAAAREAHAALRLQPHWSYVRDILLPKIESRRRKMAELRN